MHAVPRPSLSAAATLLALVLALTLAPAATPAEAAYPGQNGKVAFRQAGDVYTVNADGSGLVNLTNDRSIDVRAPVISPTGTQIAFTVLPSSSLDAGLYVGDIRGTSWRNVLARHDEFYSIGEPTWSPDGTRLAFAASGVDVQDEMYVVNADGSGLRQITDCACAPSSEAHARWSPRSNEIAFQPNFQVGEVWAVNPATGATRQLLSVEYVAYNFEWSPDGSKMAFDDLLNTFVFDLAAGTVRQLNPPGTGSFADPAWSPDGREIVAEGLIDGGDQGLYAIDATTGIGAGGTGVREVHNGLAWEENPDWGPLCEGRCESSTVNLKVRKRSAKIKVNGSVVPAHPGQKVVVKYQRKRGARWAKIAVRRPTLSPSSTYNTSFKRNKRPNRCRIVAIFRGDVDTKRSKRVKSFRC